jgi:hypothetical protein
MLPVTQAYSLGNGLAHCNRFLLALNRKSVAKGGNALIPDSTLCEPLRNLCVAVKLKRREQRRGFAKIAGKEQNWNQAHYTKG